MNKEKVFILTLINCILLISCSQNPPPTPPVVLSSSKNITAFVFKKNDNSFLSQDINGKIINDTIKVEVPFGTPLASLTPTITHSGKSISPLDRTSQNFSNTVNYTVTAEDGSTNQY